MTKPTLIGAWLTGPVTGGELLLGCEVRRPSDEVGTGAVEPPDDRLAAVVPTTELGTGPTVVPPGLEAVAVLG